MASETTKSNGRTARPEKGGRHRAARVGWHGVHDPATGGKDEQWTLVPGSTAPSDIAVWRDRSTRPGFQSSASCAGRLKGILHPDDARRAVEHWVEGVIVSNHGGRQVDGAVASLAALQAVVSAVAGRAAVLLDGGIRLREIRRMQDRFHAEAQCAIELAPSIGARCPYKVYRAGIM
jgi:hypothetical protein